MLHASRHAAKEVYATDTLEHGPGPCIDAQRDEQAWHELSSFDWELGPEESPVDEDGRAELECRAAELVERGYSLPVARAMALRQMGCPDNLIPSPTAAALAGLDVPTVEIGIATHATGFIAVVVVNGQTRDCGLFPTADEAQRAAIHAAGEIFRKHNQHVADALLARSVELAQRCAA